MESKPIEACDELCRDPALILKERGVFDCRGKRQRAATRDDIETVLVRNCGTAQRVHFDRMDLTGADLRGVDLSGASFCGCDLTNANASPLVTKDGAEIQPESDDAIRAIQQWQSGQTESLQKKGIIVSPTSLRKAVMAGTTIANARFDYALMQHVDLREVDAEGASFYKTKLVAANMRFGRKWVRVDLRGADLNNADLFGSWFEFTQFEGAAWGRDWVVKQEKKAIRADLELTERISQWEEAVLVYRELARVHESIGAGYVAGQFRFLRERAETRLLQQRALRQEAGQELIGQVRSQFRSKSNRQYRAWLWRRCALESLHGYGERPLRVLRAMVLVVTFCSLAHFEQTSFDPSGVGVLEFLKRALQAVYVSAVSTAAPGYFSWGNTSELSGLRWYLGGVQSFFGILMNALFIVTFVRRWVR